MDTTVQTSNCVLIKELGQELKETEENWTTY
jgi:hypothetical protein